MFERWVEGGLLDVLEQEGVGCIPFSPLAQGMLTDKYLNGIPENSRAAKSTGHLKQVKSPINGLPRSGNSMNWLKNETNRWLKWPSPGY
jgi:aryl-alcohol dehydrogenase-like predicted oxidoreductase